MLKIDFIMNKSCKSMVKLTINWNIIGFFFQSAGNYNAILNFFKRHPELVSGPPSNTSESIKNAIIGFSGDAETILKQVQRDSGLFRHHLLRLEVEDGMNCAE